MSENFNILEFAGLSEDRPWELPEPIPTDLRAVVTSKECPTLEGVGKAIATFVGEPIDAEKIDLPEDDRDIYNNSYTDDGLRKVQKQYLKVLQSRARTYKKEITNWWEQREAEDVYFKKPNKKTNGKADDN